MDIAANRKNRIQVNGLTLKIIAAVCMFIDHLGASVLERYIMNNPASSWMYIADQILRGIGRAAFPLYCFLLVEGFMHTGNLKKYILRLAVFAVISEIPFDLIRFTSLTEPTSIVGRDSAAAAALSDLSQQTDILTVFRALLQHQNTMFTLLLGLLTISVLRAIRTLGTVEPTPAAGTENDSKPNRSQAIILSMFRDKYMPIVFSGVSVMIGLALAWFVKGDYGMYGYLAIVVLYQLTRAGITPALSIALAVMLLACRSSDSLYALWLIIPLRLYTGARGPYTRKTQFFFYWFYPAHLLLLALTCLLLRTSGLDLGWFLTDVLS